ncbi:class I SAM-dependent methyltransferase [Pseudooceanicola sp. 200-1SW]|uniref:class I SAM-dependent methyltransferase n=1 Tax=Pseudooceanicola sp. 200-1SW TaxID=3425949 RepID=UPI003D7FA3D2
MSPADDAPTPETILAGYARAAAALIHPYETAVATPALLAPVADLLPAGPGRMLDLGAGTGRDAAHFAAQGFAVLALEPVAAFRAAGARHGDAITWRDDRMPELPSLSAADGPFDLVLANGVFHHLTAPARARVLTRIAPLCAPGARVVLSLRHGPGAEGRPALPIDAAEVIAQAATAGLTCLRATRAGSHQPGNRASGVTWTWLVLTPA